MCTTLAYLSVGCHEPITIFVPDSNFSYRIAILFNLGTNPIIVRITFAKKPHKKRLMFENE